MRSGESVVEWGESDEHDDERLTVALIAWDDAIIDVKFEGELDLRGWMEIDRPSGTGGVRALNGQKFKFRAARQPKAEKPRVSAKSRASHEKNREVQGHDLQAVVVVNRWKHQELQE